MPVQNRLKDSELILRDGAIQGLIDDLLKLNDVHTKTMDDIRKRAKTTKTGLEGLTSANDKNRKSIEEAAEETERLKKEYDQLNEKLEATTKEIVKLKAEQKAKNRQTKLEIKLNESAEGSYDRLSAQYALNKIQLNKMSKAQREGTASGKKLEKQTKDIYEEMNRLQKATGKNQLQVGDYKQALAGMPGPVGIFVSGLRSMTTAALAFAATPVGIIVRRNGCGGCCHGENDTSSQRF